MLMGLGLTMFIAGVIAMPTKDSSVEELAIASRADSLYVQPTSGDVRPVKGGTAAKHRHKNKEGKAVSHSHSGGNKSHTHPSLPTYLGSGGGTAGKVAKIAGKVAGGVAGAAIGIAANRLRLRTRLSKKLDSSSKKLKRYAEVADSLYATNISPSDSSRFSALADSLFAEPDYLATRKTWFTRAKGYRKKDCYGKQGA